MQNNSSHQVTQMQTEHADKPTEAKSLGKLARYLSMFLLSMVTIAATATITWYVNFRLSHLEPTIAVADVHFFFDLKGEKELIEIPDFLIESDQKGFFGMELKHFMTLEELDRFTRGDRAKELKKRYQLFQREIDVFITLLNRKPIDHELLTQYALDFLRSYGFNGVTSFLIYLEEKNLVTPLAGTRKEVNEIKTESGSIKISTNSYLLSKAWSKQAKDINQKFMAEKIEWFAERMALNLVNRNFDVIEQFLNEGEALLHESRKHDLTAEEGILDVIEDKARKLKKVRLDFQMVNRSDYPLLIFPKCSLVFKSPVMKDNVVVEAELNKLEATESEESPSERNSLFKAIVVNPKSNLEFSVKTLQISSSHLKEIKRSYEQNQLKSKIEIQVKLHRGKNKQVSSEWMSLETMNWP